MDTIYIRLEKPPKGNNHATSIEGRSAAVNWEKLKVFAQQLNARPLDDFLAKDPSVEVWHAPGEALTTIHRLLSRIGSDRQAVDNARTLIRDLNSFENILSAAQQRGSRFRFAIEQE